MAPSNRTPRSFEPIDLNRIRVPFRARPFRPFQIVTSSGRAYRVPGPETMAIDPEESAILIMPGRSEVAMIDVASVAEITCDFNAASRGEG